MTLTYREYPASDSRVLYPVDFDLGYLRREFIFVYSGDNPQTQLTYTWVNDNQIELATPPTAPFTIRRIVDNDKLVNDYVAGAILSADNLDDSFLQTLMIAQEVDEKVTDTEQNVIACETAQRQAETARDEAANSANSAQLDATSANQSSTSASTAAVNSESSNQQARKWAQNPVGVEVETDKYSAYHWSEQARIISETVALGVEYKGSWDASGGQFPTAPTAGTSTYMYIISVGGTLQGEVVQEGDQLVYDRNLHKWDIFHLSNAVKSVNGQTGVVNIDINSVMGGVNKFPSGVPIGTIEYYYGDTAPAGWLACTKGALLDGNTHPALWAYMQKTRQPSYKTEITFDVADSGSYIQQGNFVGRIEAQNATSANVITITGTDVGSGNYKFYRSLTDVVLDGTVMFLPDMEGNFIKGVSANVGRFESDAIRNITGNINKSITVTGRPSGTGSLSSTSYSDGANVGGSGNGFSDLSLDSSRVVPTGTENVPKNIGMLPIIRAYPYITAEEFAAL